MAAEKARGIHHMQGVLHCGQPSGSAQSRPRLGGKQDTIEHVGAKEGTSGTVLAFQNNKEREKGSWNRKKQAKEECSRGPRPRRGLDEKQTRDQKKRRNRVRLPSRQKLRTEKEGACIYSSRDPLERSARHRSDKKRNGERGGE